MQMMSSPWWRAASLVAGVHGPPLSSTSIRTWWPGLIAARTVKVPPGRRESLWSAALAASSDAQRITSSAMGQSVSKGRRSARTNRMCSAAVGAENLCHQAIFVDDATRAVMPPDPEMIQVGDAVWQRPQWRGLVQGAVRPVGVVELLVLPQHHHQVALVPDQGPVQQLTPAAADPPLHDRIDSRCLNGGADDLDPGRLEDGIERLREAGVPVMQDELRPCPGIPQVHEQVPGLLEARDGAGCSVAPRTRTRRLPCSIAARTYTFVPSSRSAVKKSSARIPALGIAGTPPTRGRPGVE